MALPNDIKKMVADAVGEAFADQYEELRSKQASRQPGQTTPERTAEKEKDEPREFDKGTRIARMVRYLYQADGRKDYAVELAHKAGDQQVIKALGESTLSGGGAMVQGDFSTDIVEVLRSAAVIRSLNPRTVPMNGGSLTMPYGATGSSASYVGENQNISKSEPTLGQIQFTARKLAALVPISNELLADSSGRADSFVRDDIAMAMASKENSQLIRADGSAHGPRGLLYLAESGNKFDANATITADNTVKDLGTAIRKVKENDVPLTRGGWIFDTRTEFHLRYLRDNGLYVFKDEMAGGTLLGFPFKVTTAVPNNLGAGTDESEIYFANFDSLVLAESDSLELSVFPGGAYHDGSGVVSGISQDQTIVRAIARHDFNSRYRGKDIAVIQAVKWGA